MATVVVITDSSACLPAPLADEFGITVLPISVYLPDEHTMVDAGDASVTPSSEALEQEELAAANRPFVTEYLEAIERGDADAAVVITPAIEFAAMYRNAALAAGLSNRPAMAIDARTAAAGQALVVLAGAAAARNGADLAGVVQAIEDASNRVELVASLDSLDPLRRSGPVPEEVLGAPVDGGHRSVFRMCAGLVEPLADAVDADAALAAIRDAVTASAPRGVERATVFHAGAEALAYRLEALLGGVDFVSGFSAAMQLHTGPGVVGVAWIPRRIP